MKKNMKQNNLTNWGHGLVGFFIGLISMFFLIFYILSVGTPINYAKGLSVVAMVYLFGFSLVITAWKKRKDKKSMLKYLIPGLVILTPLFISVVGGSIVLVFHL